MNTHMPQKGSAHVIIIIVLVCLLLTALGFVFWQNLIMQKEPAKTVGVSTQAEQPRQVDFMNASFNAAFGTSTSFRYPDTWKLDRTLVGPTPIQEDGMESTYETITLTSPSGNYSVKYYVHSRGGVGGACSDEKLLEVAKINYDELKGFPGISSAQLITKDNTASTYTYDIGLKRTDYLKGRSVGNWTCPTADGLAGVFDVENNRMVAIDAKIKQLDNADGMSMNFSDIRKITETFTGDEYEQMKAILVSTKGQLKQR